MRLSYQTVTLETQEGVGIVSLLDLENHAKASRLPGDLAELCAEIAWDEAVRVVVFAGAAKESFFIEMAPMEAQGSIGGYNCRLCCQTRPACNCSDQWGRHRARAGACFGL